MQGVMTNALDIINALCNEIIGNGWQQDEKSGIIPKGLINLTVQQAIKLPCCPTTRTIETRDKPYGAGKEAEPNSRVV